MNQDFINYRTLVRDNYTRASNGLQNCIPFLFPKMDAFFPGFEKGMLLGITGSAKSGKTALASHLVFYSVIDRLVENPDAFKAHFLWFALEEPAKKFYARLDSYLLWKYYGKRVTYNTLMSKTDKRKMPDDIFSIWSSKEYRHLVSLYDNHLTLVKYKKTSEAITDEIQRFAAKVGKVKRSSNRHINSQGDFRYDVENYTPNDPDLYVFVVIDNLTNLRPTREEHIKYAAIERLCNEIVTMKDLFNFSFVLLVQQNGKETGNLKAFLNDNILATASGIRDYPSLEADCTDLWCLSNPCMFQQLHEYPQGGGYDLDAFARNYFRVLKVEASRNGEPSPPLPLFFDGATSHFEMLPAPDNVQEINKVYQRVKSFENQES